MTCTAEGEGASGYYGGTDDEDNSGSMSYFQVKYAGYLFTNEDELNGIAFQAVGSGTDVSYVQVHNGSDDGIEWFGGTVGIKNFVVTGASDDSLDWTDGWRGFAQYGVVVQTLFPVTDGSRSKDNTIEADNLGSDMDRAPRSFPSIANVTFVQDYGGDTLQLREGTGINLWNSIVRQLMPIQSIQELIQLHLLVVLKVKPTTGQLDGHLDCIWMRLNAHTELHLEI